MEQRYDAVIEVLGGAKVTDVAARYGVSRQSVHTWVRRYRDGGLAALADRSHRVRAHPMQIAAAVEAMICELQRAHPSWGPRTLGWELARRGVEPVPSRTSIYRALVRNDLISVRARQRNREEYVLWERPGPMQLWQMDIMGGLLLSDGSEAKLITGVDDHSRFCVIASVVARPTGRLVCAAFAEAMRRFGVPLEVLTDNNGKQFTARFGGPTAGEVLFERVCWENGITLRHTAPRTPTTTGKIEGFHQTVRRELLASMLPFADLDSAQAAVEDFVEHYNTARPHQALEMDFPADRFHSGHDGARRRAEQEMLLRLPASLAPVAHPAPGPADLVAAGPPAVLSAPVLTPVLDQLSHQAIEVDRIVPDSGNLSIGGQQLWLGPDRAGMPITVWISTSHVHVFTVGGGRLKSVASRLSINTLAALIASGQARPARPARLDPVHSRATTEVTAVEVDRIVPDSGNLSIGGQQLWLGPDRAGMPITVWISTSHVHVFTVGGGRLKSVASRLSVNTLAALIASGQARPARLDPVHSRATTEVTAVEIDRLVSSIGTVSLSGRALSIGAYLAGQRITLRLDGITAQVMNDQRQLLRAVACPLPLAECVTLRGARRAGPPPAAPTEPVTVRRVVSCRGGFQVVGQKIQVGRVHARKILEVTVDDTHITVHDNGEPLRIVPRTTTQEITRTKSSAHTKKRKIDQECQASSDAIASIIK
ncbi:IS481 family transposase [Nonomuraea sp. NPDC050663]|uniref:IS481 family transposase n=1 Tax=Nonomuraea sp. NPDC050663 TaxID=3364370 RepID=UPI00378A3070